MLNQIRYFQSVAQTGSFTEAAFQCNISQSAISQQIKSLEQELGLELLSRQGRSFVLTEAGEYFYRKSLVLVSDYDRLVKETEKIATKNTAEIKVGYLRTYAGTGFSAAISEFSKKYPDVDVQLVSGTHETIFNLLKDDKLDIVFNDQRRAFSDEYVNLVLEKAPVYIEVASFNTIAVSDFVEIEDLKNIPCIVISEKEQQDSEEKYYRDILGVKGELLFAENLEEARVLVMSNKGYLITNADLSDRRSPAISSIPVHRGKEPVTMNLCAFWKKDNSGYYIEDFADFLKAKFETVE